MKATLILLILVAFTSNLIMSYPVNHVNGGKYLKTIEYNVIHPGVTEDANIYNLKHKSVIDRLFFGTKNAFVEFVFTDSPEGSNEAAVFRIIKNRQDDSYELEVMRLQNLDVYYNKLKNVLLEKSTPIVTPFWLSTVVSRETENRIREHNKQAILLENQDNLYKPYRPEPLKLQINKELAEKIHDKTSILIENFKGVGIPLNIVDGFEVTFRCVMDDELWTLSIHCPQGKALRFSSLFRQIIADGFDNKFDQSKYLKLFDEIL
ncbi:hypothetical protein [Proteiniphilum acetatigenes]|uniref:hypothetical protein n=1 Tax=Proteiniphilum acetatigenes TaxID=294710 RepID=UPI0003647DFA|nr:hypothetical protein [Proteiniphilum acetatigenes]